MSTSADPTPTLTPADCLDHRGDGCRGPVEYRAPLSATGVSFARCDKAWSDRLDTQERIDRDYPDSPHAPPWFDASYAGESWDDD